VVVVMMMATMDLSLCSIFLNKFLNKK